MDLNPERCYRAFTSHDRRFDGRIFAAVVTTGIYCRPVCPVRPAKFENSRFFACAAAAEAAGFRPCLRCRPEASPGTPAWIGTSATVSRGLRLLADGALDSGSEEQLAYRLGVSARHLRRLFTVHLGASPGAIARTRRTHFARRLLVESNLPMTEVAFSSGYTSVRQFNHAIRSAFRMVPSDIRRNWQQRDAGGGDLLLKLAYRPPFNWTAIARFLRDRAIPGVEAVDEAAYRRSIEIDGVSGAIEVRPAADAPHLLLHVKLPTVRGLIQIVERVRRIFDLGADPLPIARHLRRDRRLAPAIVALPGLRVPGAWDGFEVAVRAILGQQVSVRAATTLIGRLVQQFGKPLPQSETNGLTHVFPRPEALAGADVARIGIPKARAAALSTLAAAVAQGDLRLDAAADLDDAVARLTRIPGIGAWTAHYIAMRALGETDAFPAGDLGLRHALSNGTSLISSAELDALALPWRPWRAYAVMHLWLSPKPSLTDRRC